MGSTGSVVAENHQGTLRCVLDTLDKASLSHCSKKHNIENTDTTYSLGEHLSDNMRKSHR